MPRESIAMTHPELLGFLRAQTWMVLGTLDPDGAPRGELVVTALDDDRLCFAIDHTSSGFANLVRDPRACCAADVFPSYYEIRGAIVHGRAERVTDPRGALARIRHAAHGVAVFALPLDDVASFDFTKIRNKY
jgi:hypothetical protein